MLNIFHFLGYSSARNITTCIVGNERRDGGSHYSRLCQLKLRWQTRMAAHIETICLTEFLIRRRSRPTSFVFFRLKSWQLVFLVRNSSFLSSMEVLRYHPVFFLLHLSEGDGFDYLSDRRTSVLGRPNRRTAGGGNTIRSRTSSSWWWRRWLESSIAWICTTASHSLWNLKEHEA